MASKPAFQPLLSRLNIHYSDNCCYW
jgi:hypothetical protein